MENNQENKTGEQTKENNAAESSNGRAESHTTATSSSNPDAHERNKKAMPGEHGYNGGINPTDDDADKPGIEGETHNAAGDKRNPSGTSGSYGFNGGKK